MNKHFPLFALLAITLLFSGGCSRVTIGYNNADLLLRYKINDYTSFNAQQRDEIHREVDLYMRWHRKYALPEYTRFLKVLYGLVQQDGPLRKDDVARLRDEFGSLYKKTMVPLIRPSAHVLSTIDSHQIEKLTKFLAEKNREQKEESLNGSDQENLEKRADRTIDLVEQLVGNLSREQEDKIKKMSFRVPFATRHFIEHREANQARLISLLNSHAGEAQIAAYFSQWINTPETTRTPQQLQVIQSYEIAMDEMTSRLYELLTARQKNHLRKKILSYIEDFENLNAESRTVSTTSR